MVLPRGTTNHAVQGLFLTQFLESGFAVPVEVWRRLARLFHPAFGAVEGFIIDVAYRDYFDSLYAQGAVHMVRSAVAHADET
jgi:hypothetical protein